MRIAVVGGTGLVGRHTTMALRDAGHDVVPRRTLAARGFSVRLVPSWRSGLFSVDMAGEVLLPGPGAQLAPTTFDAWLAGEAASRA